MCLPQCLGHVVPVLFQPTVQQTHNVNPGEWPI